MPLPISQSSYAVIRAINSLVIMAITMSGMYVSIMVLEPATREFDIGRGAGALPYTLYMIGFGIGNVTLGKVMDRSGLMLLALVAAVSLPCGLYFASLAQDLMTFCLILAVMCGFLGGAFAFGPLVADISQWFDRRRGLAVGIVISGSYVAGAIWPPLMQYWIDNYGWRQTFADLALFCALTMPPLTLIYLHKKEVLNDDNSSASASRWNSPLGLGKRQLQGLLCCAGVGCCAAMAMPQIHIIPHVLDLGFAASDGANMLALMLGFGTISRITSGWISDRIGGLKTLALGSFLQAAAVAMFLFIDSLTALYILSAAFGLSQGGIVPSYAMIIRRFYKATEAGSRIGLVFVSTIGGMAFGGWIAGVLYDITGSYTLAFLNAVAFNILNLAIALFMLQRNSKTVSLQTA